MNAGPKQMLTIVGIISAILLAVWFGWMGAMSANPTGGYKPAPILSRAQQIANAEKNIKSVESNPNMSEQFKQVTIGMIRAHEPRGGATGSP